MNRSLKRGFACAAFAHVVSGMCLGQTSFETYFDDTFYTTPGIWPHNTEMPRFAGGTPEDILLADFDGDGDLDSFVLASGPDSYFQNAASGFADPQGIWVDRSADVRSGAFIARRGRVADLDADGDLDIVYATSPGGAPLPGSGAFQAIENRLNGLPGTNEVSSEFTDPIVPMPFVPATGGATDIEVVDWDGDGALDLFLATTDGLFFYSGVVGAPFTWVDASAPLRANALVGPGTDCSALAIGDLDGDGLVELFVGRGGRTFQPLTDVIIETDPAGGFVDVTAAILPVQVPRATSVVTYVDEDGDGDTDVFLGSRADASFPQLDATDVLRINDGGALPLELAVFFGTLANDTRDHVIADFDQNGELDVMMVGDPYFLPGPVLVDSGDLELLLQFGGAFTPSTINVEQDPDAAVTRRSAIAGGDVDLDLDVDLFVANETQRSLRYSANLYVQADSPRTTEITTGNPPVPTGNPWAITFSSRAGLVGSGEFWTGFISLTGPGPRVLPAQAGFVPPPGVTMIDAPIAVGPLNSVAQVSLAGPGTVNLGNIPTVLVGSTAWLQGAVILGGLPGGPQLEFSNVISTLFQ
ncbi:MAG: VCBS repeat-containing protein [Planctomycetota bacterium]